MLTGAECFERRRSMPRWSRILKNWIARRAIAKLDRIDDYILRDIGLTRPPWERR
jgi:uncharacterized protein YjiS (DUF1127 family)